ncbi:hypothetical protein ACHAXR_006155 [Thalassiosira sp. AJA248-18]
MILLSKATVLSPNSRAAAVLQLRRHLCRNISAAVASSPTSSSPCLPNTAASSNLTSSNNNHTASQQQHQRRRLSSTTPSSDIDSLVKSNFPGAISNTDLVQKVVSTLKTKGFTSSNTLLATSFCADELARVLEDDFVKIYGNNFNLGGLSGFPFAGNTGFGAMAAHIPDDGLCLVIHGPHVGICKDGTIGKVERRGMALVDNCCGSAIAASNYLKGITHGGGGGGGGGLEINPRLRPFSDFQQGAVQELILPFGKRLSEAGEDRMKELPYALYDSQEVMVKDIVNSGKGGIKRGLALLGGIQINTSPETDDYFHPLRFDYYDGTGECVDSMLDSISQ